MVVLDPERVELGGEAVAGVRAITIDRGAARLLEEWTDGGSSCVFVDTPEVRTTVKLVRVVSGGEVGAPIAPGALEVLRFTVSENASGARGQRVTATVCCVSVTHEVTSGEAVTGRGLGVVQTVVMRAVASAPTIEPLAFAPDGGV